MPGTSFVADRRLFLTRASWILSGTAAAGLVPSLLQATPAACYVDAGRYPDACGDWTVDHVCTSWPPYAYDTGPSQARHVPVPATDDIDRDWVS